MQPKTVYKIWMVPWTRTIIRNRSFFINHHLITFRGFTICRYCCCCCGLSFSFILLLSSCEREYQWIHLIFQRLNKTKNIFIGGIVVKQFILAWQKCALIKYLYISFNHLLSLNSSIISTTNISEWSLSFH